MNPLLLDVYAFMAKFGQDMRLTPGFPDPTTLEFRCDFLREEVKEFCDAVAEKNLEKAADSLIDIDYVSLGTALGMGLPYDALWREVHEANMRKIGGGMRSDGKVLKPMNWIPPDIARVLREHAPCGKRLWGDERRCMIPRKFHVSTHHEYEPIVEA